MCNPKDIRIPCTEEGCEHHVAFGMNEGGWHERPWIFKSTPESEAFKNCMCLLPAGREISLTAIGEMFGVTAQAILDMENKAIESLKHKMGEM